MKSTLLAVLLAGVCSVASAQSPFYFNRACGPGLNVSYAGNGFAFSYGTYSPRVVSYGQPWGGYYCAPAVPVNYYCPPPVYVNPCAYPTRVPYVYRPARAVVANPVFPARRYWR